MKTLSTMQRTILLLLLTCSLSFAQQGNIWYFGQKAGLDFNGGTPIPITNGQLATDEGCAAVCDGTGSLLFYTDGSTVWDQSHNTAITGLPGHSSSSQSAVIVPKPGSATNYFIFTMDRQHISGSNNGMNYVEVQLSGGTVVQVGSVVNLQLYTQCTEKIAASCHANGSDYWVTTVRRNGNFVSWPVTSAGVGSAVVSAVSALATVSGDDRVGYMKVNSQGNRLVLARRASNSQSEVFNFDNSTGTVTFNHGVYYTGTVYGVEFSANGNYFYTSTFSRVYMYDIATLTPTLLHTISVTPGTGALQMGPDGNIYVANGYEYQNSSNLDMISSVENGSPVYNDNYITLPAGHYSRLGLPDIISCFVPVLGPCEVDALFEMEPGETGCSMNFYDYTNAGTGSEIVAWQWTFGDGTSSNEQNPTHFYNGPGQYEVCLTVTAFNGEECCTSTFCQTVFIDRECDEPCEIDHHFDWQIVDDCDGCAVQFNGQLNFANKSITAWYYDFGDGTTSTERNPVHSYTYNGSYQVCLTVIANSVSPDGESECCVFTFCDVVDIDCAKDPADHPVDPQTRGASATDTQTGTAAQEDLKVYPNPSNGSITLEKDISEAQQVEISIIDHTGKVYWQDSEVEALKGAWQHTVQPDLPRGMYLMMVKGRTFTGVKNIRFEE